MKKYLIYTLLLISVLFSGCSNEADKKAMNESNEKIIAKVKREQGVWDAIIIDNVLYVSGSNSIIDADGYAQYLCHLLEENKSFVKKVKIVNAGYTDLLPSDYLASEIIGESTTGYSIDLFPEVKGYETFLIIAYGVLIGLVSGGVAGFGSKNGIYDTIVYTHQKETKEH